MSLQRELAQRVRDGLARNDMTQRDLAESADLSEKHVSQMLAGKSGTLAAWDRLLDAIGRADLLNDWFAHVEGCTGCAVDECN